MSAPFTFKPIEKQNDKLPKFTFKKVDSKPSPTDNESSVLKNVKEVIPQATQGIGIGALGSYGDILDLLGFQSSKTLPGEQSQYEMESRATPEQLPHLVETDDVMPRYSKLPSSSEIEGFGKELGIVSDPKTPAGRYAKRIGKIGGASAATGQLGLKSPIYAGATGQTLEEAGAPEWMQAAGEMIAFLKSSPSSAKSISSKSPEVENLIQKLRIAGYTEQDITLAKNALEERKILKPWARMTSEAEKSISSAVKHSEDLFKENLHKGLPGYEKGGMAYLKNTANGLYKTMEDVAQSVPVNNPKPLQDSIHKSIAYLEKHPLLPEQKQTVEFLNDALNKIPKATHADFYTEFYRNLNRAGKWLSPKQKEHVFRETKDAIKKTFNENGIDAKRFGQQFEQVNESWKKWIDVQDAMEILNKGKTEEGINFKKIRDLLNDSENMEFVEKALGKKQAKNIAFISEGAEAIQSLEKSFASTKDKSLLQGLKAFEAVKSLLTGNLKNLVTIIGVDQAQKLSTKLLIDPKYQNITSNIVNAARNKSASQAALWSRNLMKKLEEDKN